MEFKQGASVFTANDKEVGRIDRVVIDPKTKQVTDIVIRKGFLFTEDKVVPVGLIAEGVKDRITLRVRPDKLNELPNYLEIRYVAVDEEELGQGDKSSIEPILPSVYLYPAYGQTAIPPIVNLPYRAETEINIPEETVAVREGAQVIAQEGKQVGIVAQVLTSPSTNRATHFLISKRVLFKEKKLIPVEWIAIFDEDQLHLAVGARTIEQLPEYELA